MHRDGPLEVNEEELKETVRYLVHIEQNPNKGLEAKYIRKYLRDYDDHILRRESYKYKGDECRKYTSVKDILKPRCQFNAR